jgi:hypothetical protein
MKISYNYQTPAERFYDDFQRELKSSGILERIAKLEAAIMATTPTPKRRGRPRKAQQTPRVKKDRGLTIKRDPGAS